MDMLRNARQNLMGRQTGQADLERQPGTTATATAATPETTRPSPFGVLRRFAELRGSRDYNDPGVAMVSPKTPQFQTGQLDMGQTGPPGLPPQYSDAIAHRPAVTAPAMAALRGREHSRSGSDPEQRQRRRFHGADPAEMHLADMAEDGRQRRSRGRAASSTTSSGNTASRGSKKFLFCFPPVRSHQLRGQIFRCSVSGLLMVFLMAAYISLMVTGRISNHEFSVLLILIVLCVTVFFCHSLIRVCILVARPPSPEEEERYRQRRARRAATGGPFPHGSDMFTPGGFAVPRQPIRVVLARDEEAAGVESEATKMQPPAYGLWRETVRVDPNRIYWQRNDAAPRAAAASSTANDTNDINDTTRDIAGPAPREAAPAAPRPPSYASEDGVRYVVEAQPRSIAPTTIVPLPQHPAEAGRQGLPPQF